MVVFKNQPRPFGLSKNTSAEGKDESVAFILSSLLFETARQLRRHPRVGALRRVRMGSGSDQDERFC
jgi:hypothetical protein